MSVNDAIYYSQRSEDKIIAWNSLQSSLLYILNIKL